MISPTECPATTPTNGKASAGCGKSSSAASSPRQPAEAGRSRCPGWSRRRLCAVVREIEARYSREPIEPVGEGGFGRARARETRVSGHPDRARQSQAHLYYFVTTAKQACRDATNLRTSYCESDNLGSARARASRCIDCLRFSGGESRWSGGSRLGGLQRPVGAGSSGRERANRRPRVSASRSAYASRGSVGLYPVTSWIRRSR